MSNKESGVERQEPDPPVPCFPITTYVSRTFPGTELRTRGIWFGETTCHTLFCRNKSKDQPDNSHLSRSVNGIDI